MRYLACTTTGESPASRTPLTKVSAFGRGAGTAQLWGFETKIWTVSSPCSCASRRVFLNPPEVGRCRPTLFVRALPVVPVMGRILAGVRRAAVRDIIFSMFVKHGGRRPHGRRMQSRKDFGQGRGRPEPGP